MQSSEFLNPCIAASNSVQFNTERALSADSDHGAPNDAVLD